MPRIAQPITLESADRRELERWVAAHTTPQPVTQRCHLLLAAADGRPDREIAEDLQLNFKTVALWRGRKPTYSGAKVAAIIERTRAER